MVHERLTDAEIRGWHASSAPTGTPDWIVADEMLNDLRYEEQAGAIPKPGGQLVIANHASKQHDNSVWGEGLWGYGRWGTTGVSTGYGGYGKQQTVRSGDRIQFHAAYGTETDLAHRWSGMVRGVHYERADHVTGYVRVNFGGFMQEVLGARVWSGSYEDVPVSSSTEPSEAVLNDLLEDECPELDRSNLSDIDEPVTVFGNGRPVIETVADLAKQVGATVWANGDTIHFERVEDVPQTITVGPDDKLAGHALSINDDSVRNVVRVNGGTAQSQDVNSQETVAAYEDVTETARKLVQLNTTKASVPRVDLYVENAPGATGDITCRLQRDDAGAPRDVADSTKDISRTSKDMDEFPYEQSWATWRFPNHDLANPDPWLIVESDGAQGVGVDGTGNLAYRFYYDYPLALQFGDAESQRLYRRRESVQNESNLPDRQSVRDVAVAAVARDKEPDYEVRFETASPRTHSLSVGDGFQLDREQDAIGGSWIVQGVDDAWDQGELRTTIRGINVERF